MRCELIAGTGGMGVALLVATRCAQTVDLSRRDPAPTCSVIAVGDTGKWLIGAEDLTIDADAGIVYGSAHDRRNADTRGDLWIAEDG